MYMNTKIINVLIVDDSQLIRGLLQEVLSSDPEIKVVGTAVDPIDAREKIKQLNPDVITLDIEMPNMDGLTFLEKLMRLRPMPVVMISTLTENGASQTLRALELGAVDYIPKPKVDVPDNIRELTRSIISKVKQAARSNVLALERIVDQKQLCKPEPALVVKGASKFNLIAIGASTGGTEATKELLMNLPSTMPPIVIVQHMPGGFTATYAKRLDDILPYKVIELTQSEELKNNHVYVANGDQHMVIEKKGLKLVANCDDSGDVSRHKPSVDKLYDSIPHDAALKTIAVLLTGMGSDGAAGMKSLRDQGAYTITQDRDSCVVWGMPRIAVELEASCEELSLRAISRRVISLCYE